MHKSVNGDVGYVYDFDDDNHAHDFDDEFDDADNFDNVGGSQRL